jgi:hypothetical protein
LKAVNFRKEGSAKMEEIWTKEGYMGESNCMNGERE